MRVIPVIDLKRSQVVRGVAGRRDEYQAVTSRLTPSAMPRAVAEAFVERLGFRELYLADLDAIGGGPPSWDEYNVVGAAGTELLVDAGVSSLERARLLVDYAERNRQLKSIIVGLESTASPRDLPEVSAVIGPKRGLFSLDLKAGAPITASGEWSRMTPLKIVELAREAGFRGCIVLDLADVGVDGGASTLELCRQIRDRFTDLELIAGGGIRGVDDLERLAAAGCDAALVASALHDGRLGASQLARYRGGEQAFGPPPTEER